MYPTLPPAGPATGLHHSQGLRLPEPHLSTIAHAHPAAADRCRRPPPAPARRGKPATSRATCRCAKDTTLHTLRGAARPPASSTGIEDASGFLRTTSHAVKIHIARPPTRLRSTQHGVAALRHTNSLYVPLDAPRWAGGGMPLSAPSTLPRAPLLAHLLRQHEDVR